MSKIKVIMDRYIKQVYVFRLLQGQARGEDHRSTQCRVSLSLRGGDTQRENQSPTHWTARQWKR